KTLPAAICCEQEHIAKRLGQCPLATKVMGSRLCRKKDIAEWKAALKLGDLSDPFTSLLGASCIAACFKKRLGWITSMIWSLLEDDNLRHLGAYYESAHDFINKKPICQILNIGKWIQEKKLFISKAWSDHGDAIGSIVRTLITDEALLVILI
ncbi:hypothetical protein ACJX0J_039130, partial [Zea mays]